MTSLRSAFSTFFLASVFFFFNRRRLLGEVSPEFLALTIVLFPKRWVEREKALHKRVRKSAYITKETTLERAALWAGWSELYGLDALGLS